MILPGRAVALQNIIANIRSPTVQVQPCGIDLTLKHILTWTTPATIDFDNRQRTPAATHILPFPSDPAPESKDGTPRFLTLPPGSYLVEFNETVAVPRDLMGQIFVRSSLFRSGARLDAGVMDSGYRGAVGALLQVVNPRGLRLSKDARLGQLVFHRMTEPTEGYRGAYQGRQAMGETTIGVPNEQ